MTSKKPVPKGKKYKVIRDGYHPKGEPAEVGKTVTLSKPLADKLLHRGIIEET